MIKFSLFHVYQDGRLGGGIGKARNGEGQVPEVLEVLWRCHKEAGVLEQG